MRMGSLAVTSVVLGLFLTGGARAEGFEVLKFRCEAPQCPGVDLKDCTARIDGDFTIKNSAKKVKASKSEPNVKVWEVRSAQGRLRVELQSSSLAVRTEQTQKGEEWTAIYKEQLEARGPVVSFKTRVPALSGDLQLVVLPREAQAILSGRGQRGEPIEVRFEHCDEIR